MRAFLFDIDGTLILTGGAGRAAFLHALAEGLGVDCRADVPMSGRTDRAIVADLFAGHGIENTADNFRRFLQVYVRVLPECLARHQGRVLPGIGELLEQLAGHNDVLLGLLTGNMREGARIKLEHFRLFHYFQFGAFGDDHLSRDEVAHAALAELERRLNGEIDRKNVWVVGDTPLDIQCARAAGFRAAAVATGNFPVDQLARERPDLLFDDLSDPSELLNA